MTLRAEMRDKAENKNRSRGRVLLISDKEESLFVKPLATKGIEVVDVSSGTAALVSLQRSRPHLVIAETTTKGLTIGELSKMLAQSDDGIPLLLVGPEATTRALRQNAIREGAFDYFEIPAELDLLLARTEQLIALRQKIDRLRADADLDHLTGLANRRRFRTALNREVERYRRYSVPCALLLLDIDHLKRINDNFGHPTGDMVIRQIALTLNSVSRDNDTAARLGGEEFALLLAGIDVNKAVTAAERLRIVLSSGNYQSVGNVTVSIGVAGCPASGSSERALYTAADKALYVAKNSGRDQVAVAPPMQEKLPGVK